jgi:hypothetical protein
VNVAGTGSRQRGHTETLNGEEEMLWQGKGTERNGGRRLAVWYFYIGTLCKEYEADRRELERKFRCDNG